MHDKHTTDRMIASFLSRKAEEFPEVFDDMILEPKTTIRTSTRLIDVVTS